MHNFKKYKKGIITLEIQSMMPEKFINLLWRNGVVVKNVRKISITTMYLDVNLQDFQLVDEIAKKTQTKMKIIDRRGLTFFLMRAKRRIALVGGIAIFAGMLYFLSTYIWSIDIITDHNLTPYEVRQQLAAFGIKPGISKKDINVYQLEEKMFKSNDDIMWFKARIEGSRLKITALERQNPPKIVPDNTPRNLVAKKDGEVIRVYTTAGTAVVKKGDIIKSGQIVVKGEQGKEGSTYLVPAKGDVIAKTFYEETKTVPLKGSKRIRTGNKIENYYIEVKGKKFYFKKALNKFKNYDKIIDNKGLIKKETYYEVNINNYVLDSKKVVNDTVNELYGKITVNLDKSVKILDKIIDSQPVGDNCKIRLVVIAEENIALPENNK